MNSRYEAKIVISTLIGKKLAFPSLARRVIVIENTSLSKFDAPSKNRHINFNWRKVSLF